jgi:hypothetical protein
MKLEFRMHYLESTVERYLKAGKKVKGRILDELCKVCGYSRKYAIWRLHQGNFQSKPRQVWCGDVTAFTARGCYRSWEKSGRWPVIRGRCDFGKSSGSGYLGLNDTIDSLRRKKKSF